MNAARKLQRSNLQMKTAEIVTIFEINWKYHTPKVSNKKPQHGNKKVKHGVKWDGGIGHKESAM